MGKCSRERIKRLAGQFGDCWVLRDLDFFPEKFSEYCIQHDYNDGVYYNGMNGIFITFDSERDAFDASIKIYQDVLHKKVPVSLLERYWKLTSKI